MTLKKIIYSKRDKAGANIADILRTRYRLEPLELEGEIIHLDSVPGSLLDASLCIVASRHKSESGIPTLTIHSPGNFGPAGAGGDEKELGVAPALYLREGLKKLMESKTDGFEVCFEATHHGPSAFPFPVVFVEVGSTEKEWNNPNACNAVADTIKALFTTEPQKMPAAIGFGGGHYARKFSQVDEYAIGHICPKHNLEHLDFEMMEQMIEKTTPQPSHAIVERKGLGKEKEKIMSLIKETGLETILI
jgi:D-aminoacyl-tRNA deacylase